MTENDRRWWESRLIRDRKRYEALLMTMYSGGPGRDYAMRMRLRDREAREALEDDRSC